MGWGFNFGVSLYLCVPVRYLRAAPCTCWSASPATTPSTPSLPTPGTWTAVTCPSPLRHYIQQHNDYNGTVVRRWGWNFDKIHCSPVVAGQTYLSVVSTPQRQQHLTHVRLGSALVAGGVPRQLLGFSAELPGDQYVLCSVSGRGLPHFSKGRHRASRVRDCTEVSLVSDKSLILL